MSENLIELLTKLVSYHSVSADKSRAIESKNTAEFIIEQLHKLNAKTQLVENEIEGKNPIILAKIENNTSLSNKTILCYSHYDVQPASLDDGWDTDPFQLTEKDGYLYGRGASDDKGPIASLYFALKELLEQNFPFNVSIIYEGEEEMSSGGFEETVFKHRDFFGQIEGILVLDTAWFSDSHPSMDYGFRGITYMAVEIAGLKADQHSGRVGGTIREPLTDLIYLFSKLIDPNGKVLIDGFYDKVKPMTDEESKLYENIDFDLMRYQENLGAKSLYSNDPTTILMKRWRYPCLSFHGIEGAFSGPGAKTVVPARVIGKVSMRLVPDQDPKEIQKLFTSFVQNEFNKLMSSNNISINSMGTGDWWYGDPSNFLFKAGHSAITDYWNEKPAYTRSGGSIPIIPFLEKTFHAPAMGLGVGQPSDGAHSQNERIRIKNLEGTREVIKLIFKKVFSN